MKERLDGEPCVDCGLPAHRDGAAVVRCGLCWIAKLPDPAPVDWDFAKRDVSLRLRLETDAARRMALEGELARIEARR